ncbi:MAG: CBS domain-containing protein [Gammaproteobacteria bacterium]|nr:CBS domain-containing protein [Gammaproteobacteria bacterium]
MIGVDEMMTPDPYTLRESDSLHDAWRVMTEKRIRHIPVTDDAGHLLGLVTQRDVLAATDPSTLSSEGSDVNGSKIPLSDIMIKDVVTIHQSDHLRQAALYMQSHKHGCVPVLADDRLVGIITDSDFVSIAINLLEQVELLEEQADEDIMDDVEIPELEDMG